MKFNDCQNLDDTGRATAVFLAKFPADDINDCSLMLAAIEAGDPTAAAQLLTLVYDELRRLAASELAAEAPGQTLQPTALVPYEYHARPVQSRQRRNHFDPGYHLDSVRREKLPELAKGLGQGIKEFKKRLRMPPKAFVGP